ncbi:ADP-glyceromanno-heptose 6-epimerase [Putridiphycobacter roseus]|uniref:ADP-L-glycero-D-manno-heptose-6-epimerase n=1 Tax=Putridiphycobacter roseus TaxID=2219161 RepID=A0A2W1NIF2_9FLAO|nr:ADP-glyceromanno-heptose 6-epimerase [Putridiphycobacter roseus]PZE18803.1 ADP-glyceromanno-heptose 6-epimerase [Putridiphycobacter roseus]
MIVVTGAAGFISSCLVSMLNEKGYTDIVVVDDFSKTEKAANLNGKTILAKVPRKDFFDWANDFKSEIEFVFHLGARTDTTEFDTKIFDELNLNYSKKMWDFCTGANIPLVYASSGATYGLGEFGFDDNLEVIEKLIPLNPYGDSKNDFDKWVIKQENTPPFWAGLKFFNVYGPNEYHKGRMASVIFHAFHQINKTNAMKLFRSHNVDYKDGEQVRDFIYVKDVVSVCIFLMENKPNSGIYNLGTGTSRTFLDLTKATFKALGVTPDISFIDTPEDIRDKYQYFTEAKMGKLIAAGYNKPFYTLEEGVQDYVQHYLSPNAYL